MKHVVFPPSPRAPRRHHHHRPHLRQRSASGRYTRALGGNGFSWAYVFEWPFFAGYAVYMWWRFIHEAAEDRSPPADRRRSRRPGRFRQPEGAPDRWTGGAEGGRGARGVQRLPGPAGGAGQGHGSLIGARGGGLKPQRPILRVLAESGSWTAKLTKPSTIASTQAVSALLERRRRRRTAMGTYEAKT